MSDLGQSITNLSPEEKRVLLAQLLAKKANQPKTAPASFSQERMWLLQQLNPASAALNLPLTLRMKGQLDQAALQRSLDEIVRRHETLRTAFVVVEGQPVQIIMPSLPSPMHVVDLRHLAEAERATEFHALLNEAMRRTFDLTQAPLMRVLLIQTGDTDFTLHLVLHHTICDGWSMTVLARELSALYEAFASGQPSPLAEPVIQYADFCHWQRQWLQGDELASQLAYWRKQLQGSPPILELPIDHPRPAVQTFNGERVSGLLSAELIKPLKALSQQAGATLFMTLLGAFQVLLSRLSGQEDILVGSPIAGRTRAEVDGLIGVFINNLVLRTDLSGDPTFRELLARVRTVSLEAYAHQELPFEKIVEDLQPERSLSHTPLFQVMFNMLSFGLAQVDLPGLNVEFTSPPETGTNFDMTLYCVERTGQLELLLVYNADLFEHERMIELLDQYQALLAQLGDQPDRRISAYSLVTSAAQVRLPDPTRPLRTEWAGSIPDRLAQQAAHAPEQTALVDHDGAWSYRDLDELSNRLASYLRAHRVQPEDRVAVYAQRSASLVLALTGILKAGAAFVILDPAYPISQLIERLEMARPVAFLQLEGAGTLSPALAEYLARASIACRLTLSCALDETRELLKASAPDAPQTIIQPDQLAYVAFTSGSTGRPKGILGNHRALSHFLQWHSSTFDFTAGERFSMLSGLAHDPLLRDIFTPLWLGATLCIPSQTDIETPGQLADWFQQRQITVAHLTPAMSELLADDSTDHPVLKALRYAFFVGDTLTWRHVSRWRDLAPAAACVNFYGATETPQAMAFNIVSLPNPQTGDPSSQAENSRRLNNIPIGKGRTDVQLLLLNAAQQLAGIGEVGEICVRSPYLARGYLNDDALAQERFTINPLTHQPGDRLYRTGDLGRYLPDGNIEFLGRQDQQVKIRGFRVELGEIETVLRQYPAIRDTVVVAHDQERTSGQKQLVAYLVLQSTQPWSVRELRRFLADRLPSYAIPAAFVALEALPLTPNGKVDRRALPAPDAASIEPESVGVPRTPVEESLVDIWTHVMGRDQLGIHANFFEMGGHSLMATQVMSRVRQVFKVELPLRSLFESPTVAGLAEQIEAVLQGERPPHVLPMLPIGRDQSLPLSFSQERMWFIHQLQPDSSAYNIAALARLQGDLNLAALGHSFSEMARRHEDLRTTFAAVDGQPVQVIADECDWPVSVVDLQESPEAEREAEAQQLVRRAARQPFDLHCGPLLRITVYRLNPDHHLLLMVMHHIISDAWSMGVLSRELMTFYNAAVSGMPPVLPPLEIQYADFASWQRQWMAGETLANQVAYWRSKLAGVAVIELPADRPRPAIQSQRGAMQSIDLPASLLAGLHQLNQKKGVTLFMTMLAAFQVLIQRYTGQTDIAIGAPIANRHHLAIENLIGTFVNTLVLRTDLAGDPTFSEVLDRVRHTALEAYAHQDLSFAQLVAELQPERDTGHTPLFQIMFNVINVPTPIPNLTGLDVTYLEVDRGGAQFDLSCTVTDVPGFHRANITYNVDLFDAETITRFLRHYRNLLDSIVAQPGLHISALPILTEAERRQLLVDWNDTAAEYPRDKCVQHLFEEQVDRSPNTVAVIGPSLRQRTEERLTYHELNRRANQLAHYLGKLGVGPGVYVGISLERSVEMVVALLGILKAGGAYVPLDPAFPRERLAFMLQDAQVPVLLTQQSLVRELPAHSARAVCLDADWEIIAPESVENLAGSATSADLAYILYTSGSTGKPKGVEIPQRALTNFLLSMQKEPGLTANDTLVSVTTLSFDIAGLELYLPLITGARVVVVSREVAADGVLLRKALDQYNATVLQATPATWRVLIDAGWQATPHLKMLCGGEALPRDLADQILERGGTLWNMYGPTETTIWSSTYEVKRGADPIHLGHPIANTQFYILDARWQPAPIGVPGELYIGGEGVARGYLHRPELTQERFISDPFRPESRMYKTGDLARYRADGTIEFLGRTDFQVKVRGFRIELGDIEAALLQHDHVRQAVVVAREDRPGDKRLVGYLIPESDHAPTAGELRAFLKERLPDYMLPTSFVVLDQLPLTPNGKVDRRALPKPEAATSEPRVYVAPRTPLEEITAAIWAQVLKIDGVSVLDNFFEIGGHSLLATQIVARLRDRLGIELPLRVVFEAPTVAEFAERLEAIRWGVQQAAHPPTSAVDDREEIEL